MGELSEQLCLSIPSKSVGVLLSFAGLPESWQGKDNEKYCTMRTDIFERSQLASEMTIRCQIPQIQA